MTERQRRRDLPAEVEIEKGIPLPTRSRWPFGAMQIGDSFCTDAASASMAAQHYKQRHPGWNYTVRTQDGRLRIWRTA